jgi:hypothetical protein
MKRGSIFAALLFLAASSLSSSTGLAQGCMSGRDPQARALVEQGQVASLAVALNSANLDHNQVASAELCPGGGGYVYRVRLRSGDTRDVPAS